MDTQLKGKTALVTGSTAGIGYAIARLLAQEGARVCLNGRSTDRIHQAIDRLKADLPQAAQLAEQLRQQMIRVELDVRLRGARGGLRHADRVGIPLVVLVGERERGAGEVVLRVMKERHECRLPLDQLAERIAGELNKGASDGQG